LLVDGNDREYFIFTTTDPLRHNNNHFLKKIITS
jgi:hypothetical protein